MLLWSLILGARLNRDGCGHFLKREAIKSFFKTVNEKVLLPFLV